MERFLDYFEPEIYRLALEVDKSAKTIGGTVTIKGRAKAKNIKFHAVGLSVSSVRVNGKKANFKQANGVLTLVEVPRSDLEVEIGYQGALSENMQGAYLSTYDYRGGTEVIVATQFESHYAREAFPCIDEPAAKAVFELSITLPKGSDDLVLSNMPIKEVKRSGAPDSTSDATSDTTSGATAHLTGPTTIFEPTPRMSTYLLAWVIGHFHSRSLTNAHGTQITTYAALCHDPASLDFANEVAAKSLEFYDDNFGVPYPLTKLDQVALPDFDAGAMENWGLVTYRESMLLAGPTATLDTKKSVALTVAHELAHQWFGDLVTMAWWDDLWLNESFASVMEYYAVDALYPEMQIFEDFYTSDVIAALRRDALSGVQSVHQEVENPAEIATLFDPAIVYAKGARLMLMLIRTMGWQPFCRGVHDYFEQHAYQNTVGDDLWAALGKHANFDVLTLMHAFIDRPGYPVLKSKNNFTDYTQKRFLLDGPMEKSHWPIPEVREDLSGYYILLLSDEDFAEHLRRFNSLSLEEKLRLLIDRDLLAKTDLAESASLLHLLESFRYESSAALWSIMATIVNGLKIFFQDGTPEEVRFMRFVVRLIGEKLSEIGIVDESEAKDAKNSETAKSNRSKPEDATKSDQPESKDTKNAATRDNTIRLRNVLLGLGLYSKDKHILESLAEFYQEDFSKLDPELRWAILSAKIKLTPEVYDYYLEQYQATADPELKADLLSCLAGSEHETNARKALTLLDQWDVVKPQDQLSLFIGLYRNPTARERTFEWLRTHWDDVAKVMGDKSLDSYPRYLAGMMKTHAELDQFKDFFWPMHSDPALSRAIEIGLRQIESRLALIESDRRAVEDWLREHE